MAEHGFQLCTIEVRQIFTNRKGDKATMKNVEEAVNAAEKVAHRKTSLLSLNCTIETILINVQNTNKINRLTNKQFSLSK